LVFLLQISLTLTYVTAFIRASRIRKIKGIKELRFEFAREEGSNI